MGELHEYDQEVRSVRLAASVAAGQLPVKFKMIMMMRTKRMMRMMRVMRAMKVIKR